VKKWLWLFAPVVLALAIIACDDLPTSTDQKVAQQQSQLTAQGAQQTGMPGITNFTEMKLVRKLYELRDQNITTYAYVPDYQGRLWHICDSIGFGLPYGVQFSNPERRANGENSQYGYNIPQAEPNGLFMPETAEGTWVICTVPGKAGDIAPMYVEPRVVVSTTKLNAFGDWQAGK
jgi:hypothetical protein